MITGFSRGLWPKVFLNQLNKMKIAVLGVCASSSYFDLVVPGADLVLFDKEKDMLNFDFDMPVICHPPCAQWSRLKHFSIPNSEDKALAFWCKLAVEKCGGILEHPHGSSFMRCHVGYGKCISVNQSWFGFPARKPTLLFPVKVQLNSFPLNFDSVNPKAMQMHSSVRSRSTLAFNRWLVESVRDSFYR